MGMNKITEIKPAKAVNDFGMAGLYRHRTRMSLLNLTHMLEELELTDITSYK